MKWYSTFPQAPGLEPHHQIQLRSYPLAEMQLTGLLFLKEYTGDIEKFYALQMETQTTSTM